MAERMTIAEMTAKGAEGSAGVQLAEPPQAPLAMPKQVLTREAGPLWRGFGAVLTLLRRDLGRAG